MREKYRNMHFSLSSYYIFSGKKFLLSFLLDAFEAVNGQFSGKFFSFFPSNFLKQEILGSDIKIKKRFSTGE